MEASPDAGQARLVALHWPTVAWDMVADGATGEAERERRVTRKQVLIGSGAAALALAALLVFGLWWFLLRDDAPPAVSLPRAVSSLDEETPESAATASPATATPASAEGLALDGVWTRAREGENFAGYRVKEELATIGFKEAVGRTSTVEASVTIAGGELTAVSVTADLRDLTSDDSRRDGALRRQALETNAFPTATFALSEPVVIPGELAEGLPVAVTVSGALTLHGVTQPVTILIEAESVDGLLVVVGSIPIAFADYDIAQPQSPILVSIEDNGVMEFQLFLAKMP